MWAALDDAADRHTIAAIWPDLLSSLEDDSPDPILIERVALIRW
jgi:hypothetical protein